MTRSLLPCCLMTHCLMALCLLACGPLQDLPDAGPGDGGPSESGAGPQIPTDDLDRRCAADDDCLYVLAGNACRCTCTGAAIARTARPAYLEALETAREACLTTPTCEDTCPDAFVWCEAGTCRARTGPGPCGCAAGELCVQRYDGACRGGALQCIAGPAECAADPRQPFNRRVCPPGCDLTLCGDALSACGAAGGTCGPRAATPEHPEAMQCHGF